MVWKIQKFKCDILPTKLVRLLVEIFDNRI